MDPVSELAARSATELASEENALEAMGAAERAPLPTELKPLHDRLPEKGTTVALHVYWARALLEAGQGEDADQALLAVGERLNQAGYWTALARVLRPLLSRHPQTVAPLLARARSHGGAGAVEDSLLEEAHAALPHHGFLAWLAAESRLARGDETGARRAAASALVELAEEKDYDTAEMAILLLAEDRTPPTIHALVDAIQVFGRQGAWDALGTLVEVAGDALAESGAKETWPVVRDLWERHPENEDLRALATRVVHGVFTDYPAPGALIRISEIERPSQPASVVLDRLQKALRFPPGYYARHSGWGMGKILDNDTEQLILDFPGKPSHRMSLATARNALEVLPPDDIRVLVAVHPEEPVRLAREEPVSLLRLALRTFTDGEGTTDAIRKVLVPVPISSAQWSSWWKRTREEAARDPRIDARRAYQNVYRLADGSEEDTIELPPWAGGPDPAGNLPVFTTFLEHHPQRTEALLERYEPQLREVARDERSSSATRVACILWLARHERAGDLDVAPLVGIDFPAGSLSKAEQEDLLGRLSHTEGLASLLNSRWVSVRRLAWETLTRRNEIPEAARLVLERSTELPEASLHFLEQAGSEGTLDDPALPPLLLGALLDLLERPPRETHRKRAMARIEAGSPLEDYVARAAWTEAARDRLVLRLKEWQGSDRHRFPALAFLERAGLEDVAEEVEGHRARAAARLSRRVDRDEEDPYAGAHLLTRPSYEKLQAERTRVGMELKTNIPQAIQRARELGDLRENAEYDAAKAKQATYAKRFEELDHLCRQARLIEELERPGNTVLPGTEVVLEPAGGGDPLHIWILGEGDQDLGPDVVSYKAPIGQALLKKRVNEEVSLPRNGEEVPYRVSEVHERLP